MKINSDLLKYLYPVNYKEAVEIQEKLRGKVILETEERLKEINFFAACDNTIIKSENKIIAGVILFKIRNGTEPEIIEREFTVHDLTFPYIPGLLSFREIPSLIEAFGQLKTKPSLVFVDGQGYAHPRRLGLASHLGIMLGIPTIGVAKSRFIGEYKEPGLKRGSMSQLKDGDEVIGVVYRNKDKVKPVFISPGHLISFNDSVKFTERFSGKYRVPMPTRMAHIETGKFRKEWMENEEK